MGVIFEWDRDKNEGNLRKHGVGFAEASSVFGDPLADTISDDMHSEGEERFFTVGLSKRSRLLAVSHLD